MTTTTTGPASTPDQFAGLLHEFYGVRLDFAGEDGDIVMFGHVADDRRAVAAANRLARVVCGLSNIADDPGLTYRDAARAVERTYAVLDTACDRASDDDHADGCGACAEIRASGWWVTWRVPADRPGAFPVTVWGP